MSVFRFRRARAVAWNPHRLTRSKLLAWWDAEQAATITQSGGVVSSWRDAINGYTVTASSTLQPAYNATGFNGRPVLTFDGTDDCMVLSGVPSGIPTGAAPCEIWGVVDQTADAVSDTGVRVIAGWGSSATGTANRYAARVSTNDGSDGRVNSGRASAGNGTAVVNSTIGPTLDFSGRKVIRTVFDGATIYAEVDGVLSAAAACVPATATTRLRIGGTFSTTATLLWKGGINSVLVLGLLSDTDAGLLTDYLRARA